MQTRGKGIREFCGSKILKPPNSSVPSPFEGEIALAVVQELAADIDGGGDRDRVKAKEGTRRT